MGSVVMNFTFILDKIVRLNDLQPFLGWLLFFISSHLENESGGRNDFCYFVLGLADLMLPRVPRSRLGRVLAKEFFDCNN